MMLLLKYVLVFSVAIISNVVECGNDRVRLEDVKTLTLHHGKYTNGRRASPVPQLNCIGGTAGCSSFTPQVVQCSNQGSDGYDIQWECKTDMDNAYRFGRIEVSCEGYDHPDDPYVLRGSCGLDYTLDFSREGHDRKSQSHDHNYYGNQYQQKGGHNAWSNFSPMSFFPQWMSNVLTLGVILIFMYAIYAFCLQGDTQQGPTAPPYDGYPSSGPGPGHGANPPPYGFRPDYQPPGGDQGCSGSGQSQSGQSSSGAGVGGGAGNFWSGAATGGLLGYLFGSRNSYGPTYTRRRPWGSSWGGGGWGGGTRSYGGGWGGGTQSYGGGWGGGGGGWGGGGGSRTTTSTSTGTRTASGFGSTRRR